MNMHRLYEYHRRNIFPYKFGLYNTLTLLNRYPALNENIVFGDIDPLLFF
jgi:hypothetical protein